MAKVEDKPAEVAAKPGSHIRFIGHPTHDENPTTTVFGKLFRRHVWVPVANLDGTNPDKKALEPGQLKKLMGSPAFQVGDGSDTSRPGSGTDEEEPSEEA